VSDPQFCYVITTGRVTGRPHEIEIWFAREDGARTIYLLSGGGDRSDWVRNIVAIPEVTVRIQDAAFEGVGRVVADATEDALARRLLAQRYASSGVDLADWLRTALPVAIDLRPR
jgi:deazaflavin-dependent oxidoreductase (nitroreductase family)